MTEEEDNRGHDDAPDEAYHSSENAAQNGTPWPVVFAMINTGHRTADETCKSAELKQIHQQVPILHGSSQGRKEKGRV